MGSLVTDPGATVKGTYPGDRLQLEGKDLVSEVFTHTEVRAPPDYDLSFDISVNLQSLAGSP